MSLETPDKFGWRPFTGTSTHTTSVRRVLLGGQRIISLSLLLLPVASPVPIAIINQDLIPRCNGCDGLEQTNVLTSVLLFIHAELSIWKQGDASVIVHKARLVAAFRSVNCMVPTQVHCIREVCLPSNLCAFLDLTCVRAKHVIDRECFGRVNSNFTPAWVAVWASPQADSIQALHRRDLERVFNVTEDQIAAKRDIRWPCSRLWRFGVELGWGWLGVHQGQRLVGRAMLLLVFCLLESLCLANERLALS
mmetsp:Transcript_44503/g.73835  ORF Transcript_44503/g.73835 Transcript_44503/m.73835 type:complete len:250 (-) Transcript_44503:192-941(-)